MTKHTVLTRTSMIVGLFVTVFGLGSCTKKVTQVVDQGFSAVYTIHQGDWKVDNSTDPLFQYYVALNVPEIDQQIVDNGGVMVYLSFDGGTTYDALPEEIGDYTYNALHSLSTLTVGFRKTDWSTPSLPTGDVLAKVVILDATPLD